MQKTAAKTRTRKPKTDSAADSGPRNRVIERRRMDVSELAVNDKNWRLHPDSQRGALQGILAEIGKVGELYAYKSERTGGQLVLIDGHLRKEQGGVWDVAITDLTDAEADKLLTVYDPLAAEAAVDSAKLAMLLREVQTATPELADLLTKMAEANGIVPADARGTPGGGDEVPVVAAGPTRCKRGDLWIIRGGNGIEHRLYCADSTNEDDVRFAVHGQQIAACVSDPLYGIAHDTDYTRFSGGQHDSRNYMAPITGDSKPFDPRPLAAYPAAAIFGFNCFSDKLPPGSLLIWCKRRDSQLGSFMSDCEVAWLKGGHGVYLMNHVWNGHDRETERGEHLHPTQKPVAVMQWLIEKTNTEGVILDPYVGCGATMLAAHNLKRASVGIEICEGYCDIVLQRFENISCSVELQQ